VSAETPDLQQRLQDFFSRDLWTPEETARRGLAWARRALQFVVVVVQGCVTNLILLRASALTYYSILALIPLLAIALSLVKALGVSENLAQIIIDRVAAGSPEAGERILGMVQQVDFAGLGTVGAGILVLTSILGISSIENALNTIWGVKRERSWDRRVPDYLAVLIVAPLLLGVALSLGTTLQSQALVGKLLEFPGFETLYSTGLKQAPLAFLWAGFTFLYWFLPNTHVRVFSALIGGLVGAVLFTFAQQIYVGFNVGAQRYNTLFGGLAFLPLLLVWIYLSWVIVLLGAEFAFAHQNLGRVRRARRGEEPGPAAREMFGVAIAARLARAFRDGEGGMDSDALADSLNVPVRTVRSILADLERAGIVAPRGDARESFQLGRESEHIPIASVLEALRGTRVTSQELSRAGAAVVEVMADVDRQSTQALAGRTLAELAGRIQPAPEEPS
jgi:membrane protein